MSKPIVLTELAENDMLQISEYLLDNWGEAVCNKFLFQFKKSCEHIAFMPRMYRMVYKKGHVRKCILTKQKTIYYRERRDRIEILTIFDSRQNPENLIGIISKL